jgi:glycosyltransferase involved in cell wall biosynthesis
MIPDFSKKNAVIVCHDAMFGPPHELRDYLLTHKIKELLFIGHSNRYMVRNDIRSSYYEFYKDGKLSCRYTSPIFPLPECIAYMKDSVLTLFWSFMLMRKIDYFIGLGSLNAFVGLLRKLVGGVSNVIYYVIDYIPHRYKNPIMNTIYMQTDKICVLYSSQTWNYAVQMIQQRELMWNKKFQNQQVIPNGVHIRKNDIQKAIKKNFELIYFGSLVETQGIQIVLKALPEIVKRIPGLIFTLIGKGEYRDTLENQARKLGVLRHVHFLGFIKDPIQVDNRLRKATMGIAMYRPSNTFVIYTEPGKVKRYFACGLPVVMTDIGPLAKESFDAGCCMIAPYDAHIFAQIIIRMLTNRKKLELMSINAVRFVKPFEWDLIFSRAFHTLLYYNRAQS